MTQAELAARLGLSQSRLSQVERGDGSFTAEQFVEILRIFNVPLSHFVPAVAADKDAPLQNALAQLGATHLRESTDVLASATAVDNISLAIRDALLSGSPRLITALAPVIVANIERLNLPKLRAVLADAGVERRLLWLLDNVYVALRSFMDSRPSRRGANRYPRAGVIIEAFLQSSDLATRHSSAPAGGPKEILDADIRSKKSLDKVWSAASEISKRWNVVTALQPEDFRLALEQAHATA